jgi:hypothetical protein
MKITITYVHQADADRAATVAELGALRDAAAALAVDLSRQCDGFAVPAEPGDDADALCRAATDAVYAVSRLSDLIARAASRI